MGDSRSARLTRREAIGLLGMGAGLGLVTACRQDSSSGQAVATNVTFPNGAIIRTVLQDISPDALGNGMTLFHEHVSIHDPDPAWLPPRAEPRPPHYTGNVDLVVEELRATAKEGVTCIVDGSSKGLGRNMERLKTIATRSGVHIVVGGGLYTQPTYPPDIASKTADQIADDFEREASAERWGALGEIGTSLTMHPDEVKVLHAVSKFHLRTGLPIFTHTSHDGCSKCALDQLEIFESQRVDPRSVCIGHVADIRDDPRAETHKAIAKRGAFLGFDSVGHQIAHGDSKKLEMILAVLEAGYEDHVLLSSDMAFERDLKANYGAGYSSVVGVFVPKLRYAGVTETTIHKILVDNPRRFLAFVPKQST